ncbi:DUF3375 domain-containing protein [Microcella sp.]|uniref:DUF3375 domain-containing protein n=1 Tax=Microcella sp. TaxID=1913979 RepID=UPI003F70BBEC
MPANTRALRLRQLIDDDASLRLLRAGDTAAHAAAVMALLAEHLGGEERRLGSEELHERLDADLEQLRAVGFELKNSARGYVAQWRTAGFLVRRASEDARGETYELSSHALLAIRFLDDVEAPRQSATESRLASLAAQLRQLAIDTDPLSQRRLERLRRERERIDAAIISIEAGDDEPMAGARAAERVRDLLAQAAAVPDDFTRVRAEFETLNAKLREKIVESDASQGTVLDDIFRGVDLIATSDAGRTFKAFTDLVLDPAVSGEFEDNIDQILERDFALELTAEQRRALRHFVATLKGRTSEIQGVATEFARGLRRYVESQDYGRDRVLRGVLQEAMQHALAASEVVKPYQRLGFDLALTGVALKSVGVLRVHDPSEFDASSEVTMNETGVADLAALRAQARLTEIDFDELVEQVNSVLAEHPTATAGEVLAQFPASQGVASVVGLLVLAAVHGVVDEETERLIWAGTDGVERAADVDQHRFVGRIT